MAIKITPADKYFSLCVRERADWTCQRCHRQYEYKAQGLHCSHYFGRANHSVRFHELNAFAHCFGCHQKLGANPDDFYHHYLEAYGEGSRDILLEAKNSITLGRSIKKSLKDVAAHYREQHKAQRESRIDGKTGWLEFISY